MPDYKKIAEGISGYTEGKFVYLKLNTDKAKGKPSSSGKMNLTVSTAGFKTVDDTEEFRISVMGGYKV
jgi:hypothetical protein